MCYDLVRAHRKYQRTCAGGTVYAFRHIVRNAQAFLRTEFGLLPTMQLHWRCRERNGIAINSASSIENACAPRLEEIQDEEIDKCMNRDHEIYVSHIEHPLRARDSNVPSIRPLWDLTCKSTSIVVQSNSQRSLLRHHICADDNVLQDNRLAVKVVYHSACALLDNCPQADSNLPDLRFPDTYKCAVLRRHFWPAMCSTYVDYHAFTLNHDVS